MSIRGFHIIFITISTMLFIGMALWVFMLSGMESGMAKYGFGGGAIAIALALVIYGFYFYKKIKNLTY